MKKLTKILKDLEKGKITTGEAELKIMDFLLDFKGISVGKCDVCGKSPNVIIKTAFGTYCQEHVKFVK